MIDVISATVMTGRGTDKIVLVLNFPNPCWPYKGYADAKMETAAGSGTQWVRTNLNIEPDVVDLEAAPMKEINP